jgi:tRNA pseudouridine55 synthase
MDGVINLLKPPGMTSHDAVGFARKTLGIKRIGHTGTLDPAAAGVLPLCVGQATRLVEYLQVGTKEYIAEATFGFETDTGDAVGKIVSEGDASEVKLESLRGVLDSFRGNITQTPPMHSAVKIGGKKLYELTRSGEKNVEIPMREVLISKLDVTRFVFDEKQPRALLHIECSSGTYIRSLVRDIGRTWGCGATMTFLVRTRSGNFKIDEASTLERVTQNARDALLPITKILPWCAEEIIEEEQAINELAHGRLIDLDSTAARVLVWNAARSIAALAVPCDESSGKNYKPEKVFFLS